MATVETTAATTYHADIQKLYVAYFNRPADAAGLAYWETVVEANAGSTAAVSAAFAKEDEYQDVYGELTNAQVITKIYENLFGHAPDAAGKAYWVDLLDKKALTIDKIVADVAGGALGSDKTAYNNKVAAATLFTAALDTKAEQDAYSGDEANAAAKEFLSDITTDASFTAATAPAALAAAVAVVVKAGTPFTLETGLADLVAADAAKVDFLAGLDLDGDGEADEDLVDADVTAALTAAVDDVADIFTSHGVAGYAAASTAVKAAMLSDLQSDLEDALEDAQEAYADALKEVSDVDGLVDAVAVATSAADNLEDAEEAALAASAAEAAALASYNTRHPGADFQAVIDADTGEVETAAATPVALIVIKADGSLGLATGITETTNKGITALLTSIKANFAAMTAQANAEDAARVANVDVAVLDEAAGDAAALATLGAAFGTDFIVPEDTDAPTTSEIAGQIAALKNAVANAEPADLSDAEDALADFRAAIDTFITAAGGAADPLATDLASKNAAVEDAVEDIADLDEAVAAVVVAQGNDATLTDLKEAIADAKAAFVDADFKAPKVFADTDTFAVATSGADIFLVGSAEAVTISNFGLQGDDVLYIGEQFTLNTAKTTTGTGNNAVLEVFLIQSGANTIVTLETKAFSSNSADAEIKITLTGVNVADLVLENGIITHV